jgi:hypothetical protein
LTGTTVIDPLPANGAPQFVGWRDAVFDDLQYAGSAEAFEHL